MSSVRMKIMLGWFTVWAPLLCRWLNVTLIHAPSAVTTPAAKASTILLPRGSAFLPLLGSSLRSPFPRAAALVCFRWVLVSLALPVGHRLVVAQLVCGTWSVVGVARVAYPGAGYPGSRV